MDSWALFVIPVFLLDAFTPRLCSWKRDYRMGLRAFSIKLDLAALPTRRPTAGQLQLQRALTSFFLGRTVVREFSDGLLRFSSAASSVGRPLSRPA